MEVPPELPQPIEADYLKVIFDRGVAAIGLLLTSPFLALAAVLILLDGLFRASDRGPVLHRETRISKGRPFSIFKFRTMQVAAIEEMRAQGLTVKYLERQNRGQTRVGIFLRRFYLDELPQLFNILRGEMSFVGPRPPAPFEYEKELSKGIVRKRLATAGLVGLQQAAKGRTGSIEEEIALDYEYVRQAGSMNPLRRLAYDASIMVRSVTVLMEGKGLEY
jgi:lipopolysaccharide/colanic/teichoic acid biosynthesis glycosyltransferase